MLLKDKVALVTGASRGIGEAIALGLAAQGAIVIGTATQEANAEKINLTLAKAGALGLGLVLDVTKEDSVASVLEIIQKKYGNPSILVNNAAVTRDNIMLRMKDEEWHDVIETNLNSVFRLSKACLKDMLKARWGRIINISSVVACTGNFGQANYTAAKAGVIGFTKSLACEVASRNITVNAIAPGFIDTDMTRAIPEERRQNLFNMIPMRRPGQPKDIANAVLFLASDAADYITGTTLHVNGGMHMS